MHARTPITTRIRVLQFSLIAAVSLIAFVALTTPIALRPTAQALVVGVVSQTTQQSPRDIEYVSDIRTEEARQAAESAVEPVYSSPDSGIARGQIERLRTTMQYITSVRTNAELSIEEKKSNLVALSDVRFKLETIDYLVGASDARWEMKRPARSSQRMHFPGIPRTPCHHRPCPRISPCPGLQSI